MSPEEPHLKSITDMLAIYGLPLLFAVWGGTAGYINKLKQGSCRFSIGEWIGEICISGFVGVIVFLIVTSYGGSQVVAACSAGISGHMGSRAILLFETIAQLKMEKYLGISLPEEKSETQEN